MVEKIVVLVFYLMAFALVLAARKFYYLCSGPSSGTGRLVAGVAFSLLMITLYVDIWWRDRYFFYFHWPFIIDEHESVGWGAMAFTCLHAWYMPFKDESGKT